MANQVKLDLFKQYMSEYVTPKKPVLIDTTAASYLTISGRGAPGSSVFTAFVGALYAMAFTIKMTRKFERGQDYVISKLECLWQSDGPDSDMVNMDPVQCPWKLMIRTPDFIRQDDLDGAVAKLVEKKKGENADKVMLESLHEKRCVQMLHMGPYEKEGETISKMIVFITENNLIINGYQHDIYLSDPRRIPPERLKTILRLPVKENH